ncbi:MAG: hypothetical protein HC804_01790 [Anaerolineae bacterium]|nr:hypothetical protein [Anaerolineae bacterium]
MFRKNVFLWGLCLTMLGMILLVACQPEVQVVEVTRVVTETVVETVTVEGQVVEVTRVVEATVVETVEIEVPAEETAAEEEAPAIDQQTQPGDSPFSRGSEGDAVPLPTPATGPKVDSGASPLAVADGGGEGAAGGHGRRSDPGREQPPGRR